jgi:hypothetical protein
LYDQSEDVVENIRNRDEGNAQQQGECAIRTHAKVQVKVLCVNNARGGAASILGGTAA